MEAKRIRRRRPVSASGGVEGEASRGSMLPGYIGVAIAAGAPALTVWSGREGGIGPVLVWLVATLVGALVGGGLWAVAVDRDRGFTDAAFSLVRGLMVGTVVAVTSLVTSCSAFTQ